MELYQFVMNGYFHAMTRLNNLHNKMGGSLPVKINADLQ